MISRQKLQDVLRKLPELEIGLLGDLFLDRYLDVDPELYEVSVETGLEAYQITRIRNYPGALGTVMNNLAALGVGRLVPVTVIGDDGQAYDLLQELGKLPVDSSAVYRDPARRTPTYTKPMKRDAAGIWQELNRLDFRNREPMSPATEQLVCDRIDQVWPRVAGLIVLDQVNEEGWGVVTPRVREHLARCCAKDPSKLVFVDSRTQIGQFTCGVLKPNLKECLEATGRPESDDVQLGTQAAIELSQRHGQTLFCTRGEHGMLLVRPGETPVEIPGYPVAGPIDIVGAGDSATAGTVVSLLAGASQTEAAAVGNLVASITVQQLGVTGTATPQQLLARWDETHPG